MKWVWYIHNIKSSSSSSSTRTCARGGLDQKYEKRSIYYKAVTVGASPLVETSDTAVAVDANDEHNFSFLSS